MARRNFWIVHDSNGNYSLVLSANKPSGGDAVNIGSSTPNYTTLEAGVVKLGVPSADASRLLGANRFGTQQTVPNAIAAAQKGKVGTLYSQANSNAATDAAFGVLGAGITGAAGAGAATELGAGDAGVDATAGAAAGGGGAGATEAAEAGAGAGLAGKIVGAITSPLAFLAFIAWIFHPKNILRAVEFLVGLLLMGFGFQAGLQGRSESLEGFSTSESALSRAGIGRVAAALARPNRSRPQSAPHVQRRNALRQRYAREERIRRNS